MALIFFIKIAGINVCDKERGNQDTLMGEDNLLDEGLEIVLLLWEPQTLTIDKMGI